MQFQNNFDLEEFLAYLLPGFGCCVLLYVKWGPEIQHFTPLLSKYGSETLILFLSIVFFITLSFAIGQLCSVFSRFALRPIIHRLYFDPEFSIIASRQKRKVERKFYPPTITQLISEKFLKIFGFDMNAPEVQIAVPRLIRAYVLTRAPTALAIRDRIIRSRSLCANFVAPVLLTIVLFAANLGFLHSFMLVGCALALIIRQVSLDIRESKELYTEFLSLNER